MGDVGVAVTSSQNLGISSGLQYPIGTKSNINETSHGISVNEVVVYKSSAWTTFSATTDTALGICVTVIDANNFTLLTSGFTNLVTGLTANTLYYAQTDGSMSTTKTNTPIFYAVSATEGYLLITNPVQYFLSGKALSANAQTPGSGQDEYVFFWDNDNTNYDLKDLTARHVQSLTDITDSATAVIDALSYDQAKAFWSTAESTPTLTISNMAEVLDLSIKKTIAGDSVITLTGTGLKFIDMDTKATPATTVDITLSDTVNFYFEISLKKSGTTDGGSDVILVQSS